MYEKVMLIKKKPKTYRIIYVGGGGSLRPVSPSKFQKKSTVRIEFIENLKDFRTLLAIRNITLKIFYVPPSRNIF